MVALVTFRDLGLMPYNTALQIQKQCFDALIAQKMHFRTHPEEYLRKVLHHLLFVEHPHVYTLGKSAKTANLLVREDFLRSINASSTTTDRGGDITYHGPGQLVGYPVGDLEFLGLGIKSYISGLEESIIQMLSGYGISAGRMEGASGVWIDAGVPGKERKICAVGVRVSHGVSMHGFALNINTDLAYFQYINPCGFQDKGVTSMKHELGREVDAEEVKVLVLSNLQKIFEIQWH
jgi:lipoyl(octanoyl) transferase